MNNPNRKPDQDPIPKNIVPNQEPKPIPQKNRRSNLGQWDEKDVTEGSRLTPDNEKKQENKTNSKE
ncbi:hypothetical protein ABS768_00375 [Flavobacterium sp. ST-75]|uniref:Uncharacterized protein n=1 Tax=Flavobacterium rhizophilum TaxID=3163296 RepID=A0ABW8Y7P7_9FLAO